MTYVYRDERQFTANVQTGKAFTRDIRISANRGSHVQRGLITSYGPGVITAQAVSRTNNGGTGAVVNFELSASGAVTQVNVTNGGSGYNVAPTITATIGTGLSLQAEVIDGVLVGATVINGGSGYTSSSVITISGATYTNVGSALTIAPGAEVAFNFNIISPNDFWNINVSATTPTPATCMLIGERFTDTAIGGNT